MGNKSEAGPVKGWSLHRVSALLLLVAFVFIILFVSYAVAGCILYILIRQGFIAQLGQRNLIAVLLFLLLTSLGIGTIISTFGGSYFLRPLRRMSDATKKIAAGQFDVYIEPGGPYELQRLTNSFNDMAAELGRIETLQSDFVSNVSHEFKTPVSSIRGFARLLKRDNLTARQRADYLDTILLEAERLTQLSQNVLLLSNLENPGRLPESAPFSLDEQLRQSVLLLDGQFERAGVEVELEAAPLTITGNEELLKQVWLNLLGNAVKFTPAGGRVTVAVEELPRAARVRVADTGVGMDETVQQRLFDKFYQGDASHATQGNGLGLSLVKRILALCGGEVSVRSAVGEGSVFTVTLPKGD